jgi:sarcosine oxidase
MDEPCYYGFPVFGEPATKVAQDAGGKPTTADTRDFEPDPDNAAGVVCFLERYLPDALGPVHYIKTCLYTMPPDRDFVLDRLPGQDGACLAIGAGHAYKFASVIGRILAELAIDDTTPSDIGAFRFDRPVMKLINPSVDFRRVSDFHRH